MGGAVLEGLQAVLGAGGVRRGQEPPRAGRPHLETGHRPLQQVSLHPFFFHRFLHLLTFLALKELKLSPLCHHESPVVEQWTSNPCHLISPDKQTLCVNTLPDSRTLPLQPFTRLLSHSPSPSVHSIKSPGTLSMTIKG